MGHWLLRVKVLDQFAYRELLVVFELECARELVHVLLPVRGLHVDITDKRRTC